MLDRPKGNYSFLIAFAKQLADAVASHRDDDVGNYVESLAYSLEVLRQHVSDEAGAGAGGDDAGLDYDEPDAGDDAEMGTHRPSGLTARRPDALDGAFERVSKLGPTDAGRALLDSREPQSPVLKPSRGLGRSSSRSTPFAKNRKRGKRGKK